MILDTIAKACEKKPKLVILTVLIVTLLLGSGITKIEKETDMMSFLPEEKESVQATFELLDKFGGQQYEIILVRGDVTSQEGIDTIIALENDLKNFSEFVISTESYIDVLGRYGVQPNSQMIMFALQDPEAKKGILQYLTDDGKAAIIRVRVKPNIDIKGTILLTEKFQNIVSSHRNNLEFSITGEYTMALEMGSAMDRDNRVLIPAAILLIFVVLYIAYRKLSDIFFPFLVILVAVIWDMGIMGFANIGFSSLFVGITPLLLGISIAYVIHMLNRYYEERSRGIEAEKAVVTSINTVGIAVFLTALTTAFGFASFGISDLPPMRDFGLLIVLGIMFSFVLTVTLLPAILVLRDRGKIVEVKEKISYIDRIMDKVTLLALRYRKAVLLVTALVTIACLAVAPGISTVLSYEDMIPKDAESTKTSAEISELFGIGSMETSAIIIVKGDLMNNLSEVMALENELRNLDTKNSANKKIITGVFSFADVIFQFADVQLLMQDPKMKEMLSQMLIIDETKEDFLKEGLIIANVDIRNDRDSKEITKDIREIVSKYKTLEYIPGGVPVLSSDIMEGMRSTQIKTTILALVLSLIVVSLLFKSVLLGIFSIIPVGLTMIWEFGVLKIMGWNFDLFTIMVSALIIGLGIDFSIHVIYRFREEYEKSGDPTKSLESTVLNVGKAVMSATVTTAGAFFILGLSSVSMMTRFGFLVAIVIVLAFLGAILVLPSILTFYSKKK
jgi:hydrophobe/amphiphile efflux-3 (HAE3) family protein